MAKIQFSDIVPKGKRSIRNVSINSTARRKSPTIIRPSDLNDKKGGEVDYQKDTIVDQKVEPARNYEYYNPVDEINIDKSSKSKKKYIYSFLATFIVLAFIFCMMTVFSSATVVIKAKMQNISVSSDFPATLEDLEDSIKYEVLKTSRVETVSIEAKEEEFVEVEASGNILVYNNFSSEQQRLIVRTRFESPQGLIYRIAESVIIPGKTVKNGVESPGVVEVKVFADEAGEKYNLKKTDFTIPGFKNDPARYKGFYARSVADIEGGFVGKRKKISEEDKESAISSLDAKAKEFLEKDIESKIPEGFVFLKNSTIFESKDLAQKNESNNVILSREIISYAILLNKDDLKNKLISSYISNIEDWNNIPIVIRDFSGLSVVKKPESIVNNEKIDLKIEGFIDFYADINTDYVSAQLVGKKRKDIPSIMDSFKGVSSVVATIRPVWKSSFPSDASRITVSIQ